MQASAVSIHAHLLLSALERHVLRPLALHLSNAGLQRHQLLGRRLLLRRGACKGSRGAGACLVVGCGPHSVNQALQQLQQGRAPMPAPPARHPPTHLPAAASAACLTASAALCASSLPASAATASTPGCELPCSTGSAASAPGSGGDTCDTYAAAWWASWCAGGGGASPGAASRPWPAPWCTPHSTGPDPSESAARVGEEGGGAGHEESFRLSVSKASRPTLCQPLPAPES